MRQGSQTVMRRTDSGVTESTRLVFTLLVAALLAAMPLVLGGCGEKEVSVRTGERVVCTYGEEVSSSVRTIKVPADEAAEHSVRTRRVTCDRHTQLEKLYAEAQAAIEKKDLATAKKKLAEVVEGDSSFRLASRQLEDISSGRTPTVDGGAPGGSGTSSPSTGGGSQPATPTGGTDSGGSTPKEPSRPEGPVASLLAYTPDALAGYRVRPPAADVFLISREYLPLTEGPIVAIVIQVEQHRSTQAARKWLADNVKAKYTHSAQNVRIDGRDTYMANDGRRFAIVGWSEGPVSVAIEAEAAAKPGDVTQGLRTVAAAVIK